ncbi:unnamed protein product [Didymodactylos carnosus]|uniref:Uncharacterized protein n=1 Tax=Didymodactylos carnosus TaxID=1234261 RepID=A0A814TPS5_9BILA|nr:unnamed protein product [Didymodactylos carnosus]CAF3928813.1 unnamed protein product [Didymodactylos carnosus]CAF4144775.1 unnamed protein product [Didymodactylos carnosus]
MWNLNIGDVESRASKEKYNKVLEKRRPKHEKSVNSDETDKSYSLCPILLRSNERSDNIEMSQNDDNSIFDDDFEDIIEALDKNQECNILADLCDDFDDFQVAGAK